MSNRKKFKVFISHSWGINKKGCVNPKKVQNTVSQKVSADSWECIIDLNKNSGSIIDLMNKSQYSNLAIFFVSELFFTSIDCIYEAVSVSQSYRLRKGKPEVLVFFDILDDGFLSYKNNDGKIEHCIYKGAKISLCSSNKNEIEHWLLDYWKDQFAHFRETRADDLKDACSVEDLEKISLIEANDFRELKKFISLCYDNIRANDIDDVISKTVELINANRLQKSALGESSSSLEKTTHFLLANENYQKKSALSTSSNQLSSVGTQTNDIELSDDFDPENDEGCIWMTDAEKAYSSQKGFYATCYNSELKRFMRHESQIFGLHAIKGIGKTYALQMKYRELEKVSNCYPVRDSHNNDNFGMERLTLKKENIPSWLSNCDRWGLLWEFVLYLYLLICVSQQYGKSKISQSLSCRNIYFEICQNKDSSKSIISIIFVRIIELIKYNCKNENNIETFCKGEINLLKDEWTKKYNSIKNSLDKKTFAIFIDRIDQLFSKEDIKRFNCSECQTVEYYQNCFSCISRADFIHNIEQQNSGEKRGADCYSCKRGCCSCESFYQNDNYEFITTYITSWFNVQRSIIEVSSKMNIESEDTIRVYYSVRSEAIRAHILNNNTAENYKKFASIIELKYDRKMQENIYKKYIHYEVDRYLFDENQKHKNEDYAFVGTGTLRHPYTQTNETVFESIVRHSFNRTRDIQAFGLELSKVVPDLKSKTSEEERTQIVEKVINDTAANLAYCDSGECFYNEKKIFMPTYWRKNENFVNLLRAIKTHGKNVFIAKDMVEICKKINGASTCNKDCSLCTHHPFSFLYKFNMLGYASIINSPNAIVSQTFINSNEISFWDEQNELETSNDILYFLHPSLTKAIEENVPMKSRKIKHFNQFIIGEGLTVKTEILANTIRMLETGDDTALFGYRKVGY